MKQKDLYDSATFFTTDMERANEILEDFSRSLEVMSLKTSDIRIISYIEDYEDGGFQVAFSSPPEPIHEKISHRTGLPSYYKLERDAFTRNGTVDERFIEEFKKNGFMLVIKNKYFICSSSVLGTLCTRCKVSGEGFLANSVLRDSFLGERLHINRAKCNIILRKSEDNISKVFAVLGSAYAPIPQTIVSEVVTKCSADIEAVPELKKFEADNFITRMYVEYPEISRDFSKTYSLPDAITPGICVSTSDTGDSSLAIWATVRIGEYEIPSFFGEYSRKHSGNIEMDEVIENVRNNIFTEFSKAPQILSELLAIEIRDATSAIADVFKQAKFTKALGKDNTQQLMEALQEEIVDGVSYTAYDIATMIMSAPERTEGLAPATLLAFQKNVKEVLFVDYKKLGKKSEVYLTA